MVSRFLANMHGKDFDDLLGEDDVLQTSSQESLIADTTDLVFCNNDEEVWQEDSQTSANEATHHERDEATNLRNYNVSIGVPYSNALPHSVTNSRFRSSPIIPPPPNFAEIAEARVPPPHAADTASSITSTSSVLDRIEAVITRITDDMLNDKREIGLSLNMRSKQISHTDNTMHSTKPGVKQRRYSFPGKTAEEAWRFSKRIGFSRLARTDWPQLLSFVSSS